MPNAQGVAAASDPADTRRGSGSSWRSGPRLRVSSLIGAAALIVVGAAGSFAGLTYAGSYQRWMLHTATVHPDMSVIEVGPQRRVADADVMLTLKDETGKERRVLARASDTAKFAKETLT